MSVLDIKLGEKITRCWIGTREHVERYDAVVTNITNSEITCTVYVDIPRTMKFDRSTGNSLLGVEYGWIEK